MSDELSGNLSGNWPIVAGVAFLVIYCAYRFRRAAGAGRSALGREALGLFAFVAMVVAFEFSDVVGYRVMGLMLVAMGSQAIVTRKIPYGLAGRRTARNITGIAATLIGLVAIVIGLFFALRPGAIEALLSPV